MKKTIIIAIIAGIMVTLAVSLLLQAQGSTRSIVVAARDLPVGTVIEEGMIEVVQIPAAAAIAKDTLTEAAGAIGKTVVVPRAVGDLIPPAALGAERSAPAEGSGFLTVTIPAQDAAALKEGDVVAFAVFDQTGGGLLGDFAVLSVAADGDHAYVRLAGDEKIIVHLVPFLGTRSFVLVRRW